MNSIQRNLLLTLSISISMAILLAFTAVYYQVSNSLHHQFTTDLTTKLISFTVMGEWESAEDIAESNYEDYGDDLGSLLVFEFAEISLPEFRLFDDAEYYQVWNGSGLALARSHSLQGGDLDYYPTETKTVVYNDCILPDGRQGIIASITFSPKDFLHSTEDNTRDLMITMSIARSTQDLDIAMGYILKGLTSAGIVLVLLIAWIIALAVKQGLSPIEDLAVEIDSIGNIDYEHRFNSASLKTELIPIVSCLNRLLDRVEKTIDRERRFNTNVAHELRTPVAELLALADTCMNREHNSERDKRSYSNVYTISKKLQHIITSLLDLSRSEAGLFNKENETVKLSELVNQAWIPFETQAKAKDITLNLSLDDTIAISTDPILFSTILTNLFSNAVEYTPVNGEICLGSVKIGSMAQLRIQNTSMYQYQDDIHLIHNSFWRKDLSRSNTHHLGLGLSIVAAVANILDVDIDTHIGDSNTFIATVQHPLLSA